MADIVAPDIVKRLSGIIDNSEVVTVVTHTRPDGDAVGSSVAMSCFLRECRGKDAAVVLVNDYSETLDFIINDEDSILMHSIQALESERHIAESDLIICLDFNDFSRLSTTDAEWMVLDVFHPELLPFLGVVEAVVLPRLRLRRRLPDRDGLLR